MGTTEALADLTGEEQGEEGVETGSLHSTAALRAGSGARVVEGASDSCSKTTSAALQGHRAESPSL